MKTKRARKDDLIFERSYWILSSEYGFDIKRRFTSICHSEEEANAKKAWLDIKDPYDKHEVIHVREVPKRKRKAK